MSADPKTIIENVVKNAVRHVETDGEPDDHRNAPRPDPACLYGLVGDVARAGSDTTEANPFAIAANMIAYLSCAVGRGPYMQVGNTWHHARQFTLQVGRSGRGRKGDAVSLSHRIDMAVRAIDEHIAPQVHRGGLSSREGLVYLIHDGFKEGKNEVEPIHDKRLWVVESEFANVLHQGKRDGNTLSAALRDCWDGVCLKPATKSNRLYASNPHVGLSGAVTPHELHTLMDARELTNGFANRFMIFWAERTKMIAFPKATPQAEVDQLAKRVHAVLTYCAAERQVERDHMLIKLDGEAQREYGRLYRTELNAHTFGERVNGLLERRAPVLLRLAMLFALTDQTTVVNTGHIAAALAWVRYWSESVRFIFSSVAEEVEAEATDETAEKIVAFLAGRDCATRSQLSQDCLKGHQSKDRIDAALDELLSCNPPRIVVETVPRPKGTPGTPTKIYKTAAKSAKSAKSEHPCGFADDFEGGEVCEVLRSEPEAPTSLRTLRTVREVSKPLETRASIDASLNSHISQGELNKSEMQL